MHLDTYVEDLQRQLAVAAAAGGEEARQLAERLTAPLQSAVKLILLDALSAAADEITREMAPGHVELRLRGTDPVFVVTPPTDDEIFEVQPSVSRAVAAPEATDDDGGTARLNLRLPDALKQRIEEAANAEGLSLNAWLVKAATAALGQGNTRRNVRGGERYSGWVR
jgi:hypothetical protein